MASRCAGDSDLFVDVSEDLLVGSKKLAVGVNLFLQQSDDDIGFDMGQLFQDREGFTVVSVNLEGFQVVDRVLESAEGLVDLQ